MKSWTPIWTLSTSVADEGAYTLTAYRYAVHGDTSADSASDMGMT
jgi:hypothetical protein